MFLLRPSIQSLLCIRFKGKKVFIIHLLFSKVVLRLHFLFLPFEFFWLGMGDPCGLYGEKSISLFRIVRLLFVIGSISSSVGGISGPFLSFSYI